MYAAQLHENDIVDVATVNVTIMVTVCALETEAVTQPLAVHNGTDSSSTVSS